MSNVARKIYEKTMIGASGCMRPDQASKQSDADFQNDVREAHSMENAGLIQITNEHPESESGHRYIDAILFKRLK